MTLGLYSLHMKEARHRSQIGSYRKMFMKPVQSMHANCIKVSQVAYFVAQNNDKILRHVGSILFNIQCFKGCAVQIKNIFWMSL